MIERVRKFYISERLERVDPDFLDFEEEKALEEDLGLILRLLENKNRRNSKLDNPHNSILLYVTGLSNEFDFEKGRSDTIDGSPPDLDLDVSPLQRHKLIEWIVEHRGRESTAQIGTYGTFKPRSIVRRYCSLMNKSEEETAKILREIPKPKFGKEPTLEEVVEAFPDLANDEQYADLYELAKAFEGMASTSSIHAAGVVFTDDYLPQWVPVSLKENQEIDQNGKKIKKKTWVTQYDMKDVETHGVLKLDLLVIDNLDIVAECLRLIKSRHGHEIDIYSIEDGDEKAYGIINSGMLAGLFQIETSNVTWELIKKVEPHAIEEISDVVSLIRPGPREAGMDEQYWRREPDERIPEQVKELWSGTRRVLVYQEQLMSMFSNAAGYDLVEADTIRRIIGKKKPEALKKLEPEIRARLADPGGMSTSEIDYMWDTLVGCASYLFNKSHSVAYSYLTYILAYFKAHYTIEFFCALMSIRSKTMQPKLWAAKAPDYIREARALGITINPPYINRSSHDFSIQGDEIYFGFNAIRGVGKTAARTILRAKGRTDFKDVYDFLNRVNLSKFNTGSFQSLTLAGCFDRMGYNRLSLYSKTNELYDYVKGIPEYEQRLIDMRKREEENTKKTELIEERDALKKQLKETEKLLKKNPESVELQLEIDRIENALEPFEQMDLRRRPALKEKALPVKPDIVQGTKLKLSLPEIIEQAHYIGCYIDHHPSKVIGYECNKLGDVWAGESVRVCVTLSEIKEITTRRGQKMAFLQVSDDTGVAEVVVFSNTWTKLNRDALASSKLAYINGRVEQDDDPIKIKATRIEVCEVESIEELL